MEPIMINEKRQFKKPVLKITLGSYIKMKCLVKECSSEISWHGLVERNGNEFVLYKILMFPQIVSSATAETDEEEYAKWQLELMKSDVNINHLRFHGHSHVNMSTFRSNVDLTYQHNMIKLMQKDDDFYIFAILNKRNEMSIYFYDLSTNIMYNEKDIVIQIINNKKQDILETTRKEIKKYCKKKEYKKPEKYYTGSTSNYSTQEEDIESVLKRYR